MRQLKPASRVPLSSPKRVITACCPSCTMKNPVPSQINANTPAIKLAPTPALFMSGWKPPPLPEPLPPPWLLFCGRPLLFAPPSQPFSFLLKSRHSSSKSGGPALGLLPPCGCCWPGLSSGDEGCELGGKSAPSPVGFSPSRPHLESFKLNMPCSINLKRCSKLPCSAARKLSIRRLVFIFLCRTFLVSYCSVVLSKRYLTLNDAKTRIIF